MRQSIAAIALIRREHAGQVEWLAQWNGNWQRYSLVGGHKRPDESFRECIVREVGEELGLADGSDCRVAPEPLTHLEYTAWSESARQETQYAVELFEVELTADQARLKVDADPRNRWLSAEEIKARLCQDGRPVSETMALLLAKANLLEVAR